MTTVTLDRPGGSAVTFAHLESILPAPKPIALPTSQVVLDDLTPEQLAQGDKYVRAAINGGLRELQAMKEGATADPRDYRGAEWNSTTFRITRQIIEVAKAGWNTLDVEKATELIMASAPSDAGFPPAATFEMIRRAVEECEPRPMPNLGERGSIFEDRTGPANPSHPTAASTSPAPRVNVTNHAIAYRWLAHEVGTGPLSGVFLRGGGLVYTAAIGPEGYLETEEPAMMPLTKDGLAARVQKRYDVVVEKEVNKMLTDVPALFPLPAASLVVAAPDDLASIRPLDGVVHSPVVRADGSVLTEPGYDEETKLLLLPVGPQPGPVPHDPTPEDLAAAVRVLDYMLADFRFVTDGDRANYIGLMLTPLLREVCPPPYKLGSIAAHSPGSGKSFLGRALKTLHGGGEESGLPSTEEEFAKNVTAILDGGSGGVYMFDNVTGVVRSPFLAGLLTSDAFQKRRLGSSTVVEAPNDRLWLITANNTTLGGDLARRTIRVMIDPGVPNPEMRTGFQIADFERWVRENKGYLLWALLVLIRHWFSQGQPRGAAGSDSYARWVSTVNGILRSAGIPGGFDAADTKMGMEDSDMEELRVFLDGVEKLYGDQPWAVRDLLSKMTAGTEVLGTWTSTEILPEYIQREMRGVPTTVSRKVGSWLRSIEGRYAKGRAVRKGPVRDGYNTWVIVRAEPS